MDLWITFVVCAAGESGSPDQARPNSLPLSHPALQQGGWDDCGAGTVRVSPRLLIRISSAWCIIQWITEKNSVGLPMTVGSVRVKYWNWWYWICAFNPFLPCVATAVLVCLPEAAVRQLQKTDSFIPKGYNSSCGAHIVCKFRKQIEKLDSDFDYANFEFAGGYFSIDHVTLFKCLFWSHS